MKKLLLVFVLLFLCVSINAQQELVGKAGDIIQLPQECSSCSYVQISSIQYPNMTREYLNQTMTNNGSSFYYNFNKTSQLGVYNYCGYGDVNGIDTVFCYDFKITYLGKELTTDKAIIYFMFLILLVLIFVGTFIFIGFLPSKNERDEEGKILSISYLKYFRNVLYMFEWMLFISILYLFSNIGFAFLEEQLFSNTIFTLFKICLGLSPVIVVVWFIWIIVSMFHDRQFQQMLNRGVFPMGNL